METNLFNNKSNSNLKSKKDEKFHITIDDPSFFDKVEELEQLNYQMKSAKSKADVISSEIKDLGKSEWAKLYTDSGKNPGSLILENIKGEDMAQVMFIPSDKYITISENRADELRDTYGEEIIEEETTFSFDDKMVEKYGEIIFDLIMNSSEIDESDKEKIIKVTTKFNVAKGTIDKFADYGDIEEVMESVRPVVSLKNAEVIKV